MKNIIVYLLIGLMFQFSNLSVVQADEVVISGNGSSTENTATTTTSNETNIEQSNTADISNTVSINSNTGNNSASDNTGGNTDIATGDISSTVQVNNTANISSVQAGCCPTGGTDAAITGNGTGSNNTVNASSVNQTNVSVTNNANIKTNITGWANTGYNRANGNLGNTSITTGEISVQEVIKNGPINIAQIEAGSGSDTSVKNDTKLTISGNGSRSDNVITYYVRDDKNIFVNNSANVLNDVSWKLNTGGNMASDNVGNVDIKTGDIITKTVIENGPINVSTVKVSCCEKKEETKAPPPTKTTVTTTSNPSNPTGGNGGGGDKKPGEVLAAKVGKVLPATGTSWLFFATLGNTLMFMLGLFLRLRSGRSPGFALAI